MDKQTESSHIAPQQEIYRGLNKYNKANSLTNVKFSIICCFVKVVPGSENCTENLNKNSRWLNGSYIEP
jgi:NADH:ubiquinone oxidoreductase subunit B-like Fe-S oxidoreductase